MNTSFSRGILNTTKRILVKLSWIEKFLVLILVVLILFEAFSYYRNSYQREYEEIPVRGGVLVEGMLGKPRYINPLYARSEVDKTLSSLIFSGLVRYNEKKEITPSLAERWEVSSDKTKYTFYLRNDVLWHDGHVFDAEDVNYTIAVLQNPDYQENLKFAWEGVVVEKNDDYTVTFNLPKPYSSFLDNLTVGIIPHHLWVDTPVSDFPKSSLNINAIGTGPYKISDMSKNSEGSMVGMSMKSNPDFVNGEPYIENLEMKFYADKEGLLSGFSEREFSSFGIYASDDPDSVKKTKGYDNYIVDLPQYVGLFFNKSRSQALADSSVRQAISHAIDKNQINNKATYGAGTVIHSPILPDYLGYNSEIEPYGFDVKKATTILAQSSWVDQNGDGVKEKDGNELRFDLVIPDEEQFIRVADELNSQLKGIGVSLNIIRASMNDLEQNYIASRNYDLLLIGENIGSDPDPYSYWHSTQAEYPGLNLAMYENGEVDQLLEEARQSDDSNIRIKNYGKFQEIIHNDIPAIFLYQSSYVYKIYNKVNGVDLSNINSTWDRFLSIEDWYIKSRRVNIYKPE